MRERVVAQTVDGLVCYFHLMLGFIWAQLRVVRKRPREKKTWRIEHREPLGQPEGTAARAQEITGNPPAQCVIFSDSAGRQREVRRIHPESDFLRVCAGKGSGERAVEHWKESQVMRQSPRWIKKKRKRGRVNWRDPSKGSEEEVIRSKMHVQG